MRVLGAGELGFCRAEGNGPLKPVMYMRFGRRSEGVKSFRGIFGKARRDRWIPWEVYEASGVCFFLSALLSDLRNNHPFSLYSTDGVLSLF